MLGSVAFAYFFPTGALAVWLQPRALDLALTVQTGLVCAGDFIGPRPCCQPK